MLEIGLWALLALGAFTPVMSTLECYCAVALRFMVSPHRLSEESALVEAGWLA